MVETKRIIKFTVVKKTKKPKPLCKSNTVFALYASRRIKSEPGHFLNVPMIVKIDLPQNTIGTYNIPLSFANLGIKITDYKTVQKTQLEFFNTSYNKTVTIRAREPVANFLTFNEGTENFGVKHKKLMMLVLLLQNTKKDLLSTKQKTLILQTLIFQKEKQTKITRRIYFRILDYNSIFR